MANKPIKIKILGEASGFQKSLNKVNKGLGGLTKGSLAKVGGAIATAFAGAAVLDFGRTLFTLGGDLELLDIKIDTVFGDQAADVRQWADNMNESLGVSETAAAGLAANIADLLIPMQFTREEATKMATETTELAGALSAWSGGQRDAADVAGILAKAFLGEREQLKELGISINQAEVDQRALNLANKESVDELTAQDRALATQELILEKSVDAQDAYAESQLGVASGADFLRSKWADLQEILARKLLPVFARIVQILGEDVVPAIQRFADWAKRVWDEWRPTVMAIKDEIIGNLRELAEKWIPRLSQAFGDMIDSFKGSDGATRDLGETFRTMGRLVIAAMEATFTIVEFVMKAITAIMTAESDSFLGKIRGVLKAMLENWQRVLNIIVGLVEAFTALIQGDWSALGDALVKIAKNWIGLLTGLFRNWIRSIGAIWRGLISIGRSVMTRAFTAMVGAAISGTLRVVRFVGTLPGRIRRALGGLSDLLVRAGKAVIRGFLNGLKAEWERVKSFLSSATAAIPSLKGPESKDRKILEGAGRSVIGGFQRGMAIQWEEARRQFAQMTNEIGMGGGGQGVTSGASINVVANTNADPNEIAEEIGWQLRTFGG